MKLSIATEFATVTGLTLVSYSYTDVSTLPLTADDAANELLAARLLCLADDVPEAA